MMSPTSAPQPPKAVPEKKAKLRASCDACAASKVKCSKEHPLCARCASNGSQCIYGISRKHGKPGRTRKRNPDGTPFIKGSKQRPSPDGSEFGKFRLTAEPILPDLPDVLSETGSLASWSSTPEWPATPEFDYSMTPTLEPMFPDADFQLMDELSLAYQSPIVDHTPTIEPELTFKDPFVKRESMQLDYAMTADFQALKSFVGGGGDSVGSMDYTLECSNPLFQPFITESPSPQSPKSSRSYSPIRTSIEIPTSHCCHSTAYATLESLQAQNAAHNNVNLNTASASGIELKSLDSVLSITKMAVQNVLQLLACPCSSDPHLAMLYSSITSKILTWYQIAAGVKPASALVTTSPSSSSFSPSFSSSGSTFSSMSSSMASSGAFGIQAQPLKIGLFEFDEEDQEALRRQVVLRELRKCSSLVEALANWRSENAAEQAEFLYDVLGAWLKSELYKTVRDVAGEE
ncbi:hypothetical protein B0J11DRAFT_421425 [Dendryphion nanum]|uniref:Zn(2)-C6 fungal-type domain-containing protein n=1 Tax=Dendryphion nanum TaxID=256645 RepID=A0A9P9EJN1_9PLEO|nr:hypothetical protein B0J11DRAFT_421425 [Dendryphion nanum]